MDTSHKSQWGKIIQFSCTVITPWLLLILTLCPIFPWNSLVCKWFPILLSKLFGKEGSLRLSTEKMFYRVLYLDSSNACWMFYCLEIANFSLIYNCSQQYDLNWIRLLSPISLSLALKFSLWRILCPSYSTLLAITGGMKDLSHRSPTSEAFLIRKA